MVNVGFACKELDMVEVPGGNIVKLLKNTDEDFKGFGEAYFSYINSGAVKAWKKHLSMNLFLTVPLGKIKFVFFDEIRNLFDEVILTSSDKKAIIVKPNVWFGFKGRSLPYSILLNIANIPHDPTEVEHRTINEVNYSWKVK